MPTANELLADAAVDHAIDLSQYSEGVVRRMLALLNRADADLADALSKALNRLPPESFTVERLEKLLVAVRLLNSQAYARVEMELSDELKSFAEHEATYQSDLLERVVPEPVQARFRVARVGVDQVYSAALSRPFQGRLLRNWAKNIEASRLTLIRNQVRLGYVNGETTDQIVRRVVGTKAKRGADGAAFERARREMRAVVHTAVSHTAEVARSKLYERNADIIAAVVWTSTLDTHTTVICQIRDGLKYENDDSHKPIGHKVPWLQGPGRSHFGCRSASRPALKGWKALGFNVDELPPPARASMDGVVPGEVVFGSWLQKQNATRQDQVVGTVRGRLIREGEVRFAELYDVKGNFLTLEELRERDAAAFKRAGI